MEFGAVYEIKRVWQRCVTWAGLSSAGGEILDLQQSIFNALKRTQRKIDIDETAVLINHHIMQSDSTALIQGSKTTHLMCFGFLRSRQTTARDTIINKKKTEPDEMAIISSLEKFPVFGISEKREDEYFVIIINVTCCYSVITHLLSDIN